MDGAQRFNEAPAISPGKSVGVKVTLASADIRFNEAPAISPGKYDSEWHRQFSAEVLQ